jgi:hypothetical protein
VGHRGQLKTLQVDASGLDRHLRPAAYRHQDQLVGEAQTADRQHTDGEGAPVTVGAPTGAEDQDDSQQLTGE